MQISSEDHLGAISQEILHGFADAHPTTAMSRVCPRHLLQAVGSLLKGSNNERRFVYAGALKSVIDADAVKVLLLLEHAERVYQDKTREMRSRAWGECSAAKLSE